MFTISGDLVAQYQAVLSSSVQAFLPLLAAVVGTFLAFAIARQMKGLIMRFVSKA
jgi:hypothetical protein